LWRNRVVLTSGALLLLSVHLLSAGVKPHGRAAKPSIVLIEGLAPVQTASTRLVQGFDDIVHDYLDLVGSRRENRRLRAELAQLRTERSQLAELEVENRRLSELLELREALQLKAIAANIIGSDATGVSRTLILNEGSANGLEPEMAVLSIGGVVGKIISVSPSAARVLLINDHNSALDAFDQRSRARGIIAGVVEDDLTMRYVDRSEDIAKGDAIVTSGLDGIFPRGLLVGTVKNVERKGPGLFLNVEVTPAADFHRLEQVLVVTQKPPPAPGPGKG
jgi:rod shape-determining protein MreC